MIQIINYGVGNVGSILNMLLKIGCDARIVGEPWDIDRAHPVILPGVGSFDNAMGKLNNDGWSEVIKEFVAGDGYLLGICLGMQLLADRSEEGVMKGLGLIKGNVIKFPETTTFKVPHMGWNNVEWRENLPFGVLMRDKYYFVHSYYFNTERAEDVLGVSHHGIRFTSAVCCGNVYGVQFHPEKSHIYGMELLKRFVNVCYGK
jgi:glutamine amidotransferase